MRSVIEVSSAEDQRDVVHRAVQALAEGQLVAFPTETTYAIAASMLRAEAVAQLQQLAGGRPLALAVKSAEDACDYVPNMSPLAQRLARRCWPGPVTLRLDDAHPDSLLAQLPEAARAAVTPEGIVSVRVPAHDLILAAMRLMTGPLLLLDTDQVSGGSETIKALGELSGEQIGLLLDDGPCKFGQPGSIVRVEGRRLQIESPGVLSATNLMRLASYLIVLVCTGNTCRSPMAEALLRRRLAARLQCQDGQLEEQGVMVISAGIAAMSGGRATPEAQQTLAEQGLDLSRHESQPLSERLVKFADLVLTMTRGHRQAIVNHWPELGFRVHLLRRDQGDVSDPIGGPLETYRSCAAQIDGELEQWLSEIDLDSIPQVDNS